MGQMKSEARNLAKHLLTQWPTSAEPSTEGFEFEYLEALETKVMERVRHEWKRLRDNLMLSNYVEQVQAVLNVHVGCKELHAPQPWSSSLEDSGSPSRGPVIPSFPHELLLKHGPSVGEYARINDEMLLMSLAGHSTSEDLDKGPPAILRKTSKNSSQSLNPLQNHPSSCGGNTETTCCTAATHYGSLVARTTANQAFRTWAISIRG